MSGNIIFVGLMGAGKTTVGKLLAKQLGQIFYDSDHEIEKKTGVSIPYIFEVEGEEGFRKRESGILQELCAVHEIIIATGGGAVLKAENRATIKAGGTVIYLRATVHDLWLRTKNDKNRPLLQAGNAKQKLQQLFNQRDALYREIADFVVDTGGAPASQIVQNIIKKLNDKQMNSHQLNDNQLNNNQEPNTALNIQDKPSL